jgi:glycosyltransferase involved in cell wall biosynthesis
MSNKITVIVPVYNVEKYLSRCIESIINQSYQYLEIILVNDGSTDSSLAICEKYKILDSRIIIISQNNKGLACARNSGLKIATGDYVGFIDSDDRIDLNMVSSFVCIIKKMSPDIILSNILHYETGNTKYKIVRNEIPYNIELRKKEIEQYLLKPFYGGEMGIIPSCCTKVYSTSFLKKNNLLFDESLKRAEDYWFNFFVFKNASNAYVIDKAFYHYYSNEGSMIRSFREDQFQAFFNNRAILLKEHEKFDFPIDWIYLNNKFLHNINELILLEINVKGISKAYKNICGYLLDEELLKIYKNSNPATKHVKLIRFLLSKNKVLVSILIFYIWSIKAK